MHELFWKYPLSRALPGLAVAAIAFAPLDTASAAYTYKRLRSFCSTQNFCPGGAYPGGLVMDQNGILYGATSGGGKYDGGVVFKLVPNGSRYTEYTLHNFCNPQRGCTDGSSPTAVILDVDGNLYGTTQQGGSHTQGTIFKLTHGSNGWAISVLHNFCADGGQNCTDGAVPGGLSYAGQSSGQAWDGFSPLYGATGVGGKYNNGAVFILTTNGWNYSLLHSFGTSSSPNDVLVDSAANIYGTTGAGGKYGGGLMYKLASGTWSETILHNFCNSQNCADGNLPVGRLAMDASGNLFGATAIGGNIDNTGICYVGGCGVVFERASGDHYSVLYSFCSQAHCVDGATPGGDLIIDSSGNLFGTTASGGAGAYAAYHEGGTAYELSGGTMSLLYSFCNQQNCTDGDGPGPLIPDSSGGFFGTTYLGGTYDLGTAFRLGS